MNDSTINLLIYLGLGFASNLYLIYRYKKKGKSLNIFILEAGGMVEILLCLFLWPLIVLFLLIELYIPEEMTSKIEKTEKSIQIGEQGITITKMMLSGKIQVGEIQVDASSISGPLEKGEIVEIISCEMNQFKVKKAKPEQAIEPNDETYTGNQQNET